MRQLPVHSGSNISPWILILLMCFSILSCAEKKRNEGWKRIGRPVSEWTSKSLEQNNQLSNHTFLIQENFEFILNEKLDSATQYVFYAPDSLEFDLYLNNQALIRTQGYSAAWPSSKNASRVAIYPNDTTSRPFLISTDSILKFAKNDSNKFILKVYLRQGENYDLRKASLYASVPDEITDAQITFAQPQIYEQDHLPRIDLFVYDIIAKRDGYTAAELSVACPGNVYCRCNPSESSARIKIRGFTSAGFPKKQLSIKLESDSSAKNRMSFFGLNPSSKWILQGPYADHSLIRNPFMYELSRRMGYWAPNSRFVELVINNNYQGVFLWMEKIDIENGRLDLNTGANDSDAFLVQLNRPKQGDVIVQSAGIILEVNDPPKIKLTDEYLSTIQRKMEDAVLSFDGELNEDIMDVNSFADYVIMQELAKNLDAYYVSTYFHKNHAQVDDRLKAGPIWDFDFSFGNTTNESVHLTNGFMALESSHVNVNFRNLFSNPKFQKVLKGRYGFWRKSLLKDEVLFAIMDSLVNDISTPAINRNFLRWPVFNSHGAKGAFVISSSHTDEISSMKTWLQKRLAWLDDEWSN